MKFLAYIFSIAFFRVLALLPRFILLGFADLLFVILYYLVGYRKKIAKKNISTSFPEYSDKQVSKVARKFYRHLADVILESSASLYYPQRRLEKMVHYINPELIDKYVEQGKNIILVTGHYNNWELTVTLSYTTKYQLLGVYKPLKNKYYNKAIQQARGRYGARLVPMKQIAQELIRCKNNGELTVTGLAFDQRPIKQHIQYWTEFLHQKTPVFLGSEKLAKKFNCVVLYIKTRKIKRGVYSTEFELITENPLETKQYEITDKQFSILEQMIREEPAYWLWTHDRWKHKFQGES